MKVAFITGITGQVGALLTHFLLECGYVIHGMVRRTSSLTRVRLDTLTEQNRRRVILHYCDLGDSTTLRRLLLKIQPHEFYHLAGQSHVGLSFDIPESTCMMSGFATLSILEVLRDLPTPPKFYHASSSEVFGAPLSGPQNEDFPFRPNTPYGCAKAFATNLVKIYREKHGLFACNGICYNHESHLRGENFVTKKICVGVARIANGLEKDLKIQNISGTRDWGYAPDFVEGIYATLQASTPEDYVFSTGKLHSVEDIIRIAFQVAGIEIDGMLSISNLEPQPLHCLVGDSTKAKRKLHWEPTVSFEEMITRMTQYELSQPAEEPR